MSDKRETYQSAHKPEVMLPGEEMELQNLIDSVFAETDKVDRVDLLVRAETDQLADDLIEVLNLLPQGCYKRIQLVDQLNSIIVAHGWGYVWGTVE